MILFMGNTWFIIQYFIEEIGFHINHLFEMSFATQAFEIWIPSASADLENTSGFDWAGNWLTLDYWASNWSIFYWAWWVSWAPFVGLFIARISKGRTIREFILGNMVVPTVLTCVWFSIFGGAGLQQQIAAENADMICADCYDSDDNYIDGCQMLLCRGWNVEEMLFDLLDLYPLTRFMTFMCTLGLTLYFVTSSDSASAVIDQMTSNGLAEGPIWQRIFWAVTEGATAHAVLTSGGAQALKALRSISIIAAFPFCLLMLVMICTFIRFLFAENDPDFQKKIKEAKDWNINIFDSCFTVTTCGGVGMLGNIGEAACALIAGPFLQIKSHARVGGSLPLWAFGFTSVFLYLVVWSVCTLFDVPGAVALSGSAWLFYVAVGVANRMQIREKFNIGGTCIGDFCTFMWCGPFAIYQEYMAVNKGQLRPWGPEVIKVSSPDLDGEDGEVFHL